MSVVLRHRPGGWTPDRRRLWSTTMRVVNPMFNPIVRRKVAQATRHAIRRGVIRPYGRHPDYGNGRKPTPAELALRRMFPDAAPEWVVGLADGELPRYYRLDLAFVGLRLAAEVDGSSHRSRAERDARKDARLTALGWKVVRVRNEDVFTGRVADILAPFGVTPELA